MIGPCDHASPGASLVSASAQIVYGRRKIKSLRIFPHAAVCRKLRCQSGHAFTHPLNPGNGYAYWITLVELGNHLVFEQVIKLTSLGSIPSGIIPVLLPIAECPPQVR